MVEMQDLFSLEHVGKSPSKFNLDKLLHLNAHYIKMAEPSLLATLLVPSSRNAGSTRPFPVAHQGRADAAGAVPHPRGDGRIRGILLPPKPADPKAASKFLTPGIAPVLLEIAEGFPRSRTSRPIWRMR